MWIGIPPTLASIGRIGRKTAKIIKVKNPMLNT